MKYILLMTAILLASCMSNIDESRKAVKPAIIEQRVSKEGTWNVKILTANGDTLTQTSLSQHEYEGLYYTIYPLK